MDIVGDGEVGPWVSFNQSGCENHNRLIGSRSCEAVV